eukprot:2243613-Alexandrium_andersonii.AAC.1
MNSESSTTVDTSANCLLEPRWPQIPGSCHAGNLFEMSSAERALCKGFASGAWMEARTHTCVVEENQ